MTYVLINRFSYWDIVGISLAARLLVDDWTTIMWVAPSLLLWILVEVLIKKRMGVK